MPYSVAPKILRIELYGYRALFALQSDLASSFCKLRWNLDLYLQQSRGKFSYRAHQCLARNVNGYALCFQRSSNHMCVSAVSGLVDRLQLVENGRFGLRRFAMCQGGATIRTHTRIVEKLTDRAVADQTFTI